MELQRDYYVQAQDPSLGCIHDLLFLSCILREDRVTAEGPHPLLPDGDVWDSSRLLNPLERRWVHRAAGVVFPLADQRQRPSGSFQSVAVSLDQLRLFFPSQLRDTGSGNAGVCEA